MCHKASRHAPLSFYHALPRVGCRRCYRHLVGICNADMQLKFSGAWEEARLCSLPWAHPEVVNGYNADDSLPRMPEEQVRASEKHYGSFAAHCFSQLRDVMVPSLRHGFSRIRKLSSMCSLWVRVLVQKTATFHTNTHERTRGTFEPRIVGRVLEVLWQVVCSACSWALPMVWVGKKF